VGLGVYLLAVSESAVSIAVMSFSGELLESAMTIKRLCDVMLSQMTRSLKTDNSEPERFKSSRQVTALLSDLNRRLGLTPDSHLSYGQIPTSKFRV